MAETKRTQRSAPQMSDFVQQRDKKWFGNGAHTLRWIYIQHELENFLLYCKPMLNAVMDEKRQISIFGCSFNISSVYITLSLWIEHMLWWKRKGEKLGLSCLVCCVNFWCKIACLLSYTVRSGKNLIPALRIQLPLENGKWPKLRLVEIWNLKS